MQDWSSDVLLHIIQYLNIIDSGRFGITSRRNFYLVHHYRDYYCCRGGAELVANISGSTGSHEELCRNTVKKLQTKPKFGIAFTETSRDGNNEFPAVLSRYLPDDTVILCAAADAIQSSGVVTSDGNGGVECVSEESLFLGNVTADVDVSGNTSDANKNENIIVPFLFENGLHDNAKAIASRLADKLLLLQKQQQCKYKMFIILCVGEIGTVESDVFVKRMQRLFPSSTIVGGICTTAYVSIALNDELSQNELYNVSTPEQFVRNFSFRELMLLHDRLSGRMESPSKLALAQSICNLLQTKKYNLQQLRNGICGIAIAGNIPVQPMVSRGVISRTTSSIRSGHGTMSLLSDYDDNNDDDDQSPIASSLSTLYVVEAEYVRPTDSTYIFGDGALSYHVIRTIQDRQTLRSYTPSEVLNKYGHFEFLGIRRPNEIGYKLETLNQISEDLDLFVLIDTGDDGNNGNTDNNNNSNNQNTNTVNQNYHCCSLVGANIDLFTITGRACVDDMEDAMRCLKEQTSEKEILGAIMFSCNGRGPSSGFIPEVMMDARKFHKYFPTVPCLGFYGDGEIGPIALACSRRTFLDATTTTTNQNNNDTNVFSNHGNACVQGFTAVFALFIVPTRDPNKIEYLDDCEGNIEEFIQKRFKSIRP